MVSISHNTKPPSRRRMFTDLRFVFVFAAPVGTTMKSLTVNFKEKCVNKYQRYCVINIRTKTVTKITNSD